MTKLKTFYTDNIVVCVGYEPEDNSVSEIFYIEAREKGKVIDITESMMKHDLSETILSKIDWAEVYRNEMELAY